VKLTLMLGTYLMEHYPGRLYTKAQNLRRNLDESYESVLRQLDILALPTTPMKAHRYNADYGANGDRQGLITHGWNMVGNTFPFNLTGHPALTIPCAKSDGLPVGFMLAGRKFDESTLFKVGRAFEQGIDWQKAS
jgi:amidase